MNMYVYYWLSTHKCFMSVLIGVFGSFIFHGYNLWGRKFKQLVKTIIKSKK